MADLSNYGENLTAEALTDEPFIKLHTGHPGEDGTANAATETDHVKCKLKAASGGKRETEADTTWEGVSTEETYTHVSVWDHVSAGNCEWVAALTIPVPVKAGDDFTIDAGDLSITLS